MACSLITLRRLVWRFVGSLNICLLPGSLWKCIRGLLLIFSFSQILSKGSLFTFLDKNQATLENICCLNEHHPYSSMAWLNQIDLQWFFAKIYALQQGLSKANGCGKWTLKWGFSSQRKQLEHRPPTCPSLTPSSSWAPESTRESWEHMPVKNCELCTLFAFHSLFFFLLEFNLHPLLLQDIYTVLHAIFPKYVHLTFYTVAIKFAII